MGSVSAETFDSVIARLRSLPEVESAYLEAKLRLFSEVVDKDGEPKKRDLFDVAPGFQKNQKEINEMLGAKVDLQIKEFQWD